MTLLCLIISCVVIFLTMTLFLLGVVYLRAWGGSSRDDRQYRHLLVGIVYTVGGGYICGVSTLIMLSLLMQIFTKII